MANARATAQAKACPASPLSLAGRRPTYSPASRAGGRTESVDPAFKAHESTLIWRACVALIGLDDQHDRRQRDVLTWAAELLGRPRSSLGKWTSPRGDNCITTWGLRAFRQAFSRFGQAQMWEEYEQQILSDPFSGRPVCKE